MPFKNRFGFGILEVMIGAALLMTSILGALFISGINATTASDNPISIGIEIARSSIVNVLQNDQAWRETVQDVTNVSLDCIRNSTDCFSGSPAGGAFILKDAANSVAYDGLSTTAGFTIQGSQCNTFDPVQGNPLCPIHFDLRWEALCDSSPCINPPIRVTGTIQVKFSEKRATVVNLTRFNFDVVRKRIYCGGITSPWNFVVLQAPASCTATTASSGTAALVFPAGMCRSAADIDPCLTTRIGFNYAPGYSGGALASDAQNQASICFYEASQTPPLTPCIYEWQQNQGIWSLAVRGVTVYTAPATEALNSFLDFEFYLNNGLMRFYVNGSRRYIFNESFRTPLRILIKTPSTSYAPTGFTNLKYRAQ